MNKMKSLLIYNSNIANKTKKDYNVADTISYYCNMANIHSYDYNIDFFSIDSTLKDLDTKEFDIIYIKDSLTINYLDFIGMELAYHIRFTQKFKYVPIVILSDLDGFTLSKLTTKAQILLTKNTFLNKAPKTLPRLDDINYKTEFLDKISVEQPKDTSGSHGIANKWSIYRWAEFLNIDTDATKINKSKIEEILYFKYLKAKYKAIDELEAEEIQKLSNEGKILFIDDEWDKGWSDVLKKAFSGLGKDNFKTFEYDYQDKTNFNLITIQLKHKDLKEEIENADVVILDLRLIESDHTHNNIDDYAGVKILKEIHKINAGIQVIMLTATSKSIILDKLYEYKILGYIKKEHPDDISISTSENINKLVQLADKGLGRKYLKEIFTTQNNLLELNLFKELEFSFDMSENDKKLFELKNTLSLVFNTLNSNIERPFVYGMLTIFKCIEIINDYFIYEQWNKKTRKIEAFWKHNNNIISKDGNKSVNNKIKNIIKLLNLENVEDIHWHINELTYSRNYEIHPSEDIKENIRKYVITKPDKENILNWFNILAIIIKNIK